MQTLSRAVAPRMISCFPSRVFVPDDGILGRDHDVGLSVAVYIGGCDCVADLAGVRVDLLGLKSGEIGRAQPEASSEERKQAMKSTHNDSDVSSDDVSQ